MIFEITFLLTYATFSSFTLKLCVHEFVNDESFISDTG